jgi:hypothetical protein
MRDTIFIPCSDGPSAHSSMAYRNYTSSRTECEYSYILSSCAGGQQTINMYANEKLSVSKFVNNIQSSKLLILNFMIKTPVSSFFVSDVTYRTLSVDKVTKFKMHSETEAEYW